MNVAIVGVGNCAWSLLQSIELVRRQQLHFTSLIGRDVCKDLAQMRVVLGFDVNEKKIGRDISVAAKAKPNCTTEYVALADMNAPVLAGPLLDGLGNMLQEIIVPNTPVSPITIQDLQSALVRHEVDAMVIYLPVGAQQAAEAYARAALAARCAVINCTPAVLGNSPEFAGDFLAAGVELLGDDMRSHMGSTTVHQALLKLLQERGLRVKSTYQLNIGGNTDFLNMRDPTRSQAKRRTKLASLAGLVDDENGILGIGPSDYVPSLQDRKVGYINIRAEGFLGMDISMELKLSVEDSPNAAPIALDALAAVAARRRGEHVDMANVCTQLFKAPRTYVM